MKLKDLQPSRSKVPVYSGVVADAGGKRDYELSVTGSRPLVERVFENVVFTTDIEPQVSKEQFEARSRQFLKQRAGRPDAVALPGPPNIDDLGRKQPPRATPKDSVVVHLRRIRGEGTFWAGWFPRLFIPAGANLFFVLPRVWTCWGFVAPTTGDPDLFLSLGAPTAPPVMAATAGGTTTEGVTFTGAPFPWTQFAAWFRINGFTATVTDFGMVGHSIP
jgi:hypothetical protein